MLGWRRVTAPRKEIEKAGGLFNQAGLAKRWGVSKQAVAKHVRKPDFPAPVAVEGDGEVWFGMEADAWRATTRRTNQAPSE